MKKWLFSGFFIALLLVFLTSLTGINMSWKIYKHQMLYYQKGIPGWCSAEKAEKMADLIYETRPRICVEIGVYAGSSAYPTAAALAFLGEGILYAIDPWSNAECLKGYAAKDPNALWWDEENLEAIYNQFNYMLMQKHLTVFCRALRSNSQNASAFFQDESIDILHVDGNHSEEIALNDVKMFLPKLKKGGYLWFDDVDWASTNKAVAYVQQFCRLDVERSIGNSCCLFQKN
ncbi:MAG: class I SAM-dependent methyltransferase [Parachlamydiales bacterium]|jgi:hypothetical protein